MLLVLDKPLSISGAWEAAKEWREVNHHHAPLPFWWFALALDSLFAMKAIRVTDGLLERNSVA
ncbi:hypothetical protein IWX81_002926 [Salinibacterium sp. CAN_S4]|uniref:ABC-three component system middle component 6 n=1 Tax=Salinibacterium sp. CAN_S4 TaxID=2787727 RepID=UPI0018F04B2B